MSGAPALKGERFELACADPGFPDALRRIPRPPEKIYGVGSPDALVPGLAVIGARKATPYGISCAERFARLAAEKGVNIISGGARGCDSAAHRAALRAGGTTVVFLGGGCDDLYPPEHRPLFQSVIDAGGAIVSERHWRCHPRPFTFRERNRLIAGLADAVLIVEAGLPSGTFSTADEALEAGKEVLVVPGAITSQASHGSNRLLYQGATPVIDDDTFEDALFRTVGALRRPGAGGLDMASAAYGSGDPVIEAIRAEPLTTEELYSVAVRAFGEGAAQDALMERLVEGEAAGAIARQASGRWAAVLPC